MLISFLGVLNLYIWFLTLFWPFLITLGKSALVDIYMPIPSEYHSGGCNILGDPPCQNLKKIHRYVFSGQPYFGGPRWFHSSPNQTRCGQMQYTTMFSIKNDGVWAQEHLCSSNGCKVMAILSFNLKKVEKTPKIKNRLPRTGFFNNGPQNGIRGHH